MSTPVNGSQKMGVMPVGRLLISLSLPIMFSMLVQALYNVVDSIFIARMGETTLSAVSLAFPMQSLMIAVATGTMTGMNALLSRTLGEKDGDKANAVATNGLFLASATYLVFLLVGILFTRAFFAVQTDDPLLIQYGTDYLSVCLLFSFSLFGQFLFERLLQSTGRATLSMVSQVVGAVANIILDPILIFGYLGMPALGVKGAAIATVIGQFLGLCTGIVFHVWKNTEIRLRIRGFQPDWALVRAIYSVGIPAMIMQAIGSVMTFVMNGILIGYTTTATAVFGIYFKLQSFVFMPVFGLSNGIIPIVSYNLGAGNHARIHKTIRLGMVYATAVMAGGTLVFQLLPDRLLSLFQASRDMLQIGVPALRIISAGFLLAGISIVSSTVFQSLGHGMASLMCSAVRQLVVLLPTAYLLSLTGILSLIWVSFPVAEVVCLAVSLLYLRKIVRTIPAVPLAEPGSQTAEEAPAVSAAPVLASESPGRARV